MEVCTKGQWVLGAAGLLDIVTTGSQSFHPSVTLTQHFPPAPTEFFLLGDCTPLGLDFELSCPVLHMKVLGGRQVVSGDRREQSVPQELGGPCYSSPL